jgi:hypothetical protein
MQQMIKEIENDSNSAYNAGVDIVEILTSCEMLAQPQEEPPKNGKSKYAGYYTRYSDYKKQYYKENREKINEYQKQRYRAKSKQSKLLKALDLIQSNITTK